MERAWVNLRGHLLLDTTMDAESEQVSELGNALNEAMTAVITVKRFVADAKNTNHQASESPAE